MTEAPIRIRNRYYVIDFERETFHRAQPCAGVSNYPNLYGDAAAEILTCRYWRNELTEEQNAAANAFADGGASGDDINVIITGLEIMKERSYLQAVADADEETIAELDAYERGIA
ncbi:hypothetical protein [Bradyrhizobium sp. CCBAU 51753]|uniref:hypothetical protein n=1 Tax=Bradyrhizobium sp. CCBAU 51753 TaxID=1325100 RepID=UPI00188D5602|nr:hypothetical protein [Bradyrhizobium sp. CCBAU 51753]QOZ26635.1 hypothetical protein XH93_25770 [Bradyrhizobium sp. CCBAU 51753]